MFPFEVGAAAREEFHDAGRRAGDKSGVILLSNFAEVDRIETVHILVGRDAPKDRDLVDVFRQRRLHQDAVD